MLLKDAVINRYAVAQAGETKEVIGAMPAAGITPDRHPIPIAANLQLRGIGAFQLLRSRGLTDAFTGLQIDSQDHLRAYQRQVCLVFLVDVELIDEPHADWLFFILKLRKSGVSSGVTGTRTKAVKSPLVSYYSIRPWVEQPGMGEKWGRIGHQRGRNNHRWPKIWPTGLENEHW